jgi:hypothetical protein
MFILVCKVILTHLTKTASDRSTAPKRPSDSSQYVIKVASFIFTGCSFHPQFSSEYGVGLIMHGNGMKQIHVWRVLGVTLLIINFLSSFIIKQNR